MTLLFFTEPACTLLINLTFNYVSLTTKFQAVVSSVTLSFQTLSLVILAFFLPPRPVSACRGPYVYSSKYTKCKVAANIQRRKLQQAYFDEVCMGTGRMSPPEL